MDVTYSADNDHINEAVLEIAQARPGQVIRVRIQPELWRGPEHTTQYARWRGVSWNVECPTAEEAIALREALVAFFEKVGVFGAALLQQKIEGLQ